MKRNLSLLLAVLLLTFSACGRTPPADTTDTTDTAAETGIGMPQQDPGTDTPSGSIQDDTVPGDDGNIILRQSDNKELKKSAFQNLPERVYWPKLVKIFERDGMATEITDLGLVLTW